MQHFGVTARVKVTCFKKVFPPAVTLVFPHTPFGRGHATLKLAFPQFSVWSNMWTAGGKTVLNLAAHTRSYCLTFLESHLV